MCIWKPPLNVPFSLMNLGKFLAWFPKMLCTLWMHVCVCVCLCLNLKIKNVRIQCPCLIAWPANYRIWTWASIPQSEQLEPNRFKTSRSNLIGLWISLRMLFPFTTDVFQHSLQMTISWASGVKPLLLSVIIIIISAGTEACWSFNSGNFPAGPICWPGLIRAVPCC